MAGRENVSLEAAPRVAKPKEEEDGDDLVLESDSQSELESDSEDETRRELRQMREEQSGEGGIEVREEALGTLEAGSSAGLHLNSHLEGSQANCCLQEESKERGGMTHQELLATVMVQAIHTRAKNQVQTPVYRTSSSQFSPNAVNQTVSSVSCSTVYDQNLLSGINSRSLCSADVDIQGSNEKPVSSTPAAIKTYGSDGYNWRKYGQKQVKSPKGSRSYFRCTYSGCSSKKIECCDHVGHVLETVYRSHHNHDPPRKVNSPRESRVVRSVRPSVQHSTSEQSVRDLGDTHPSTSFKEPARETPIILHGIQRISNGCDRDGETTTNKEDANKEPKHSGKRNSVSGSESLLRQGKKPKFVVHAAGDVGISADGYRWRKYGQKMVKGNPHPRNYYRCTSAGCPVRKHIESAADNASAAIITYKGIHDHDMPVPKKRHGPPSAPLVAAAAKKPDPALTETKWSVDTEGELTGEAMELGGEKAMESARTLLSIGFEIKPC